MWLSQGTVSDMYEGLTTSLEGLTTRWVVIDDLLTWRLCLLEPWIFSILTKQLLIPRAWLQSL